MPSVSRSQRERVRQAALDLGFVACGFTSAAPLGCGPILAEWLSAKRHGYMEYLARDGHARVTPRAVSAEARSIVVAAWPYRPGPPLSPNWRHEMTGRIASYALGPDYHTLLGDRLAALAEQVHRTCGGSTFTHVDSGPLVEKELARRAGLGWYGRNTNLLAKYRGSYFLLACLLTEAEFPPDAPFDSDHCGICTACIPACPTGALDDGPTIDARLCISYLTIELRGPIPVQLRPAIGNWVFGCDVCQEVCPWNEEDTAAADVFLQPALAELLLIDREKFDARFKDTAVSRAKPRTLARNAAVALGNTGNPLAVPVLAEALLNHAEPLVRAHAAWALGRIGGRAARPPLLKAIEQEQIPPARAEVAAALAALQNSEKA